MTPERSSRATRSATAGGERLTRLPSSASDIRPSAESSDRIRRSMPSTTCASIGRTREMPSFMPHTVAQRRGSCISRSSTPAYAGPMLLTMPRRPSARTLPAQAYFAGSAVFHYLGPSFAVLLFARVDVLGVAWMRIASAALVFAAWRRPWRRLREIDAHTRLLLAGLGAVFACMNACFYLAVDRLPLATVAAVEFLGPIGLALAGARTGRNWLAVASAATGVYLLTHVQIAGGAAGVGFALANAVL